MLKQHALMHALVLDLNAAKAEAPYTLMMLKS